MIASDLGGRAARHDAPLVEDRDPVAQPLRVVQDVRREDDALATAPRLDHEVADLPGGEDVEVGGGLVEHQDRRVVDDGPRDRDLLLLA